MDSAQPTTSRVYGPRPSAQVWAYVFCGGWGVLVGLIARFVFPFNTVVAVGVGVVAALFVAMMSRSALKNTRLEISPRGVRVGTGDRIMETPWSNLASVRLSFYPEIFITHEPIGGPEAGGLEAVARSYQGIDFWGPEMLLLLRARRCVTIRPFVWYLRHGDLAAEVDCYAPHLRIREALAAANRPPTPEQRRIRVVGALWAAGVVLDVVLLRYVSPLGGVLFCVLTLIGACLVLRKTWASFCQRRIWPGILGLLGGVILLSPSGFVFWVSVSRIWKDSR